MPNLNATLTRGQWTAVTLTGLAISNTLAAIAYGDFDAQDPVSLTVQNTGANPLNGFAVKLRVHRDAPPHTLADASAEFADQTLIGCVGSDGAFIDPTTLASGASVQLTIPRHGSQILEIWASSASGSVASVYIGPQKG